MVPDAPSHKTDATTSEDDNEGEFLGREHDSAGPPHIYADIAASITQYTERPDLLIDALERHDPGFVQRMNDDARSMAKETRKSRHRFGEAQAYTGLVVSVIMALGILGALFYAISKESAGFWFVISLVGLLAVSQGGRIGFLSIIEGIRSLLSNKSGSD